MSVLHPSDREFDDYVCGAIEEAPRIELEAHVRLCELCAHKLYLHARAEEALYAVAPRRRVAGPRRLLAAAAVLLALSSGGIYLRVHRSLETETISLEDVICPDGEDQPACIEAAHSHGRYVAYPAFAGGPPIAAAERSEETQHLEIQGE